MPSDFTVCKIYMGTMHVVLPYFISRQILNILTSQSQVLYSLKVSRIKYLPNSAQKQIFTDTIFIFKSRITMLNHVPAHGHAMVYNGI